MMEEKIKYLKQKLNDKEFCYYLSIGTLSKEKDNIDQFMDVYQEVIIENNIDSLFKTVDNFGKRHGIDDYSKKVINHYVKSHDISVFTSQNDARDIASKFKPKQLKDLFEIYDKYLKLFEEKTEEFIEEKTEEEIKKEIIDNSLKINHVLTNATSLDSMTEATKLIIKNEDFINFINSGNSSLIVLDPKLLEEYEKIVQLILKYNNITLSIKDLIKIEKVINQIDEKYGAGFGILKLESYIKESNTNKDENIKEIIQSYSKKEILEYINLFHNKEIFNSLNKKIK